jgi:hypothetical protein
MTRLPRERSLHDGFKRGNRPSPGREKRRKVLTRVGEAETQAQQFGYKGVDVYVKAVAFTRDQMIDFARNGPVVRMSLQGTLHTIDILVADGQWVHIEGGSVR